MRFLPFWSFMYPCRSFFINSIICLFSLNVILLEIGIPYLYSYLDGRDIGDSYKYVLCKYKFIFSEFLRFIVLFRFIYFIIVVYYDNILSLGEYYFFKEINSLSNIKSIIIVDLPIIILSILSKKLRHALIPLFHNKSSYFFKYFSFLFSKNKKLIYILASKKTGSLVEEDIDVFKLLFMGEFINNILILGFGLNVSSFEHYSRYFPVMALGSGILRSINKISIEFSFKSLIFFLLAYVKD